MNHLAAAAATTSWHHQLLVHYITRHSSPLSDSEVMLMLMLNENCNALFTFLLVEKNIFSNESVNQPMVLLIDAQAEQNRLDFRQQNDGIRFGPGPSTIMRNWCRIILLTWINPETCGEEKLPPPSPSPVAAN
ncbi:hypothetical protein Tsp_07592 [Trichinella spiralis]|uniref:hypothetical protein n=1 Tax=Trichinella spiralis TaxID=6334 RepID=UPI0001EFC024|nr:hypothetical protein Tsp_07592 [Trichinella spiralis]